MKKSILTFTSSRMTKTILLLSTCLFPVAASATGVATTDNKRMIPEGAPIIMPHKSQRMPIKGTHVPVKKIPLKSHAANSSSVKLLGNVIYSNYDENYVFDHPYGIYSFDGQGNFEFVGGEGMYSNSHAVPVGDRYYSMTNDYVNGAYQVTVNVYSMSDWSLIKSERVSAEFMAQSNPSYDPATGLAYGTFLNSSMTAYEFCSVDFNTLTRTKISDVSVQWISSFIDSNGILYMIGQNGKIYKVNKENGDLTEIGDTGFPTNYGCSATFDPMSGKGYWAAFFGYSSCLFEIDPATGACEMIKEFDTCDEIMGLMPAHNASPTAPLAPTDLSVNFEGGSLTGNLLFTMPDKTVNGQPMEGNLSWQVEINGIRHTDGTAAPGSDVSVPVTVPVAGWSRFVVSCSNDSGTGQEAVTRIFVGVDTPQAPFNVVASWNDGMFNISWDAVSLSANGGYVNFDELRYDVYRHPGHVKVAEAISATNCSDAGVAAEMLNLYFYEVVAKADGKESEPGISNKTVLGEKIYPPFANDFSSQEAFDMMTTVDGNSDGNTWIWDETTNAARIKFGSVKMDDWLMTPAIHLEAGDVYRYSVGMHCVGESYPEEFEIKMGKAPTADQMTIPLVPQTSIASRPTVYYEQFIEIDETGDYYIGVHGLSDADLFYIYVDEFSISGPMSKAAPEGVEDIKIKVDKDNNTDVMISFRAPAKDLAGVNLENIDRIEIKRDSELVKTFTDVTPGAELAFTDIVPRPDNAYIWSFIPFNVNGAGKAIEVQAFAGINIPGKCDNVILSETEEKGVVTLSWSAPATDEQGYPFDADNCTYTILGSDGSKFVPIVDDIDATNHTFRAVTDGTQAFRMYGVQAKSSKGAGAATYSAEIPVGAPYSIPWTESFPNLTMNSIFGVNYLTNMPNILLTPSEAGVSAKDKDGGFLVIESEKTGTSARMFTGKIDLSDAVAPQFTCYIFNYNDNGIKNLNEVTLQVSADLGKTFTDKRHVVIGEDCPLENDWNRLSIDLSEYIGQEILVGWLCTIRTYSQIHLDALSVEEKATHDLELCRITVPANVRSGVEFDIDVELSNVGSETATGYKVILTHQGEDVMTAEGTPLEPGATKTQTFKYIPSVLDDETSVWKARVEWPQDMIHDNNSSSEVSTLLSLPSWPTVRNLQCSRHGQINTLTWIEPEIDRSEPALVTETFEEYEPFATQVPGWTFHDGDKAPIGGFQNVEFPIAHMSNQSFWVHDTSYLNGSVFGSDSYAAHSGEKYLASLFRQDDKTVDDWAISPRLSGKSQTISVWAKSYDADYKESFEILWSDGTVNTDGFTLSERFDNIPAEWTEYHAVIPAGAERFAIRSVGTGAFMFMVDDVSYIPESFSDLEVVGYNVYRNRELLNGSPLKTTTFNDDTDDKASYHVSVVYKQGESTAVSTSSSGVYEISLPKGVSISGNAGITVRGADGMHVDIFTADGRCVYSGSGSDEIHINVTPGLYMTVIDNACVKIVVR